MKEKNLMLSGKLYKAVDDELKQDFLYEKKNNPPDKYDCRIRE